MISLKGFIPGKNKQPDSAPKKEQAKSGNIFGQSLNVGQVKKAKKEEYIQAKNKKKASISLGISLVALTAYSVLFFFGNASAYLKAPAQISGYVAENQEYTEVILPSLEKTKDLHKAAYDQEFEEIISSLDTVFPNEIDKLGIIRLLESFATEVDANFPPFEFTSINLSAPTTKDSYLVIPASTSIHSSLDGFDAFLSLIDKSGYIYSGEGEGKALLDKKVRLMSISNISVKYRGIDPQTGKDGGVDFSVKLNIYSRSE